MNVRDLYKSKAHPGEIVEIIRTYNKRDIDEDCPLSVAIIGMVEFIYISGDEIGRECRMKRSYFNRHWVRV